MSVMLREAGPDSGPIDNRESQVDENGVSIPWSEILQPVYDKQDHLYDRYFTTKTGEITNPSQLLFFFKMSFKYSAGSPPLQVFYQIRYARLISEFEGGEALLKEMAQELPLDHDRFAIPTHHANIGDNWGERSEQLWLMFIDICSNPYDLTAVKLRDGFKSDHLEIIDEHLANPRFAALFMMSALAGKETDYMRTGRPNKVRYDQKYRSDFHDIGLQHHTTGSDEFDLLFSELGLYARLCGDNDLSTYPQDVGAVPYYKNVYDLRNGWESRFGQPFFE
jgi:hypothetical protein